MKLKLPRYPWDRWFRRKAFTLRRGQGYRCQPHSMSVQVRSAAQKRGLRVSVLIRESILYVRRV